MINLTAGCSKPEPSKMDGDGLSYSDEGNNSVGFQTQVVHKDFETFEWRYKGG